MTYNELYHHYRKRVRLCRDIIHEMTDRNHNHKWHIFVSALRYYDDKLKWIDKFTYNMILSDSSRYVGNYGNYFSDPVEMEKYKEKIRLRDFINHCKNRCSDNAKKEIESFGYTEDYVFEWWFYYIKNYKSIEDFKKAKFGFIVDQDDNILSVRLNKKA